MTRKNKTEKKGLLENSSERTCLTPADHEAFFSTLDNPPEPTEKLRDAFDCHARTVVSLPTKKLL
ncbi:DUF1778 domain-containing protein [Tepidicaulis sp. LMO-SS28]|uniref:type II toxin -antitoxin system TacA 1-like antitoxin n=1 Tax=Tepidicaulis sp. LMO-SS28 TaxID=3447455 RepID=UPI003EE3D166